MKIDKDVLRILNESDEYTFADWFGKDLTGQTYEGDIDCINTNLTSLKGAPQVVKGDFTCWSCNSLTSLEGAPQEVESFYCYDSKSLTSLEGAPQKVIRNFECSECKSLTSLKGAPKEVGRDFKCWGCNSLTSLEGSPQKAGRDFCCSDCESLASLEGSPQKVGRDFCCSECNSLTSLKGAPKEVGGGFDCSECNSLTSLEGSPQKVGGDFNCSECNSLTSLEGSPQEIGGKLISNNSLVATIVNKDNDVSSTVMNRDVSSTVMNSDVSSTVSDLKNMLSNKQVKGIQKSVINALIKILKDISKLGLAFEDLTVDEDSEYPSISFHWLGHWTNVPYNPNPVGLCEDICSTWDSMPWAFYEGSSDGWEMAKDDFETVCNIVSKYAKKYNIPISIWCDTKAYIDIMPGSEGFDGVVSEWTSKDMVNNYNVTEKDIETYFMSNTQDFDQDELEDYDYTEEDAYEPLKELLGF